MSSQNKNRRPGKLSARAYLLLVLIPIVAALIALAAGRMWINPASVFESIANKIGADYEVSNQIEKVLWNMRFPRIILAIIVGAGLSVAGCVFQSLFSNPLATPDTLGVASGASFGAALALLLGFGLLGTQLIAFAFGAVAVMLTFFSGLGKGRGMNTVVLAGIMIGSLFSALVSLVKFSADTESQLPAITYWLMGSMNGKNLSSLVIGGPVILIGIIIMILLRWRLNILPLSEDEAKTSGINIRSLRIITVLCATAMTASCVSMCGQVGWVGLLVPHMCRMRVGSNHLSLIPACVCVGAAFMVIVDTLARTVSAAEIPVSILTAIIGAPFFITLLRRSSGWQL